MKRDNIKIMLEGIEDKYLEEAIVQGCNYKRIDTKKYKKIAVAAVVSLFLLTTGVSVIAATNHNFRDWIQTFYANEKHSDVGKGVEISREDEGTEQKNTDSKKYYLELKYVPEGYTKKGNESIFYGANNDTDFFTVAYFHLQSEFTNVLPQADQIEKHQTNSGLAYIATSRNEHRAWLLFDEEFYMLELRDRNKVLSVDEIKRVMDGASLSEEKPSDEYDVIEWTEELRDSYKKELERFEGIDSFLGVEGAK